MSGQLTLVLSQENVSPAAVWEMLPPQVRAQVTVMLARLLATMVEEARDEGALKVTERHRQRRGGGVCPAVHPGQVQRNTESAARQYALAERAVELGWPAGSVLVVDEDTGMSGRWAHARIGFRELVAEVGWGHVGVILALEVSRLARSGADWHQLLDLCALTDTLIADADGIYCPGSSTTGCCWGSKGR